jgi:hypothetical protein
VTTICRTVTNSSSIFQLRSAMPAAVGAVWWLCMWQPCSNPYLPLYAGADRVPAQWGLVGERSAPAYLSFGELARWVEADYAARIKRVRPVWKTVEERLWTDQSAFENRVLRAWRKRPEDAPPLLSAFSSHAVHEALARAEAFTAWRRHTIDSSSRGADGVRLHDINGDGLMDIATGWEEGGCVRAYVNPGPERAAAPWPQVTVGNVRSPEDAVFVDLDGDGAVDVVSSCEGKVRTVWVHWAPRDRKRYRDPGAWQTEALPASQGKRAWMYCLPLQVDGKHGVDLIAGAKGKDARIGWFEAPSRPRELAAWRWHPIYEAGWIMSLAACDMDGDGDTDILASDRKGSRRGVFWLENPGAGPAQTETWTVHPITGAGKEVMFLTLADVDRDGLADVLAAVSGKEILYARRTAAASPSWETTAIALPARCGRGKAVAAGDIDLDGRQDIVFSCEHANGVPGVMWLSYAQAPADRTWAAHDISGSLHGVKYDLVELIDLDGDGDLDVLTCEERNNLGVVWYENPVRGPE